MVSVGIGSSYGAGQALDAISTFFFIRTIAWPWILAVAAVVVLIIDVVGLLT
ncbi:hypothetical protein [Schumannella soli]|uniref:hypothetical protein n=1 Tax=Schumannella soli TaxID=2590779 RepID=UPI0015E84CD8|nr:hypothetical protein [Schumannella soli]